MRVLGMISGTSHDGIDVAVVDFADGTAAALAGRIEYSASVPYDPQLRGRIIAALPPAWPGFEAACELDTSIGQAFAGGRRRRARRAGPGPARPDLLARADRVPLGHRRDTPAAPCSSGSRPGSPRRPGCR